MARNPLYSLAVVVASAILLLATSATAAPAPAGALFHSDFADYGADWHSLPWVPAPSITQLDDAVEASVSTSSLGRFSSRARFGGLTTLDDLNILLEADALNAGYFEIWLSFFGADGLWIGSTEVYRATSAMSDVSETVSLTGTSAPAGWTDFALLFFVRGGPSATNSVQFDEVALVLSPRAVVPEPSTGLLLGLGLFGLSAPRRRED